MNKDYVLYHLGEAKEELIRTLKEFEQDPAYGIGDFTVAMQHLYHHLNTAWNARDVSEKRAAECSDADFKRWRMFPADLDMSS